MGRSAMYINVKRFSGYVRGKTLDVGCGSKPYLHLFRNATEYIGLDVEQSGHSHKLEQIDVFYDGQRFPFGENTFDSLVFFEVLEHVFNPDTFLDQIRTVVKPGGYCLITVPFMWGEHEQPYDYARYSSFGLRHLLEKHGFEVIRSKKYLTDARLIFLLINSYIYTVLKKYLPGLLAWTLIVPLSFLNNLLGLISYVLPGNQDLYFGSVYLLKINK
ncbi:MAG: class I SAM-dependent methyltransferase [Bacteroidota bacterium]